MFCLKVLIFKIKSQTKMYLSKFSTINGSESKLTRNIAQDRELPCVETLKSEPKGT